MSLSRNLVDLYVLASAVTKVGTSVIASQSNAVCMHVKTSSLLNPTPKHQDYAKEQQSPLAQGQQTQDHHIEVPFPDYVDKTVEIKSSSTVKEVSSQDKPTVSKEESAVTMETQHIVRAPEQTKVIETAKATESKETVVEPLKAAKPVETPTVETIVKEVVAEEKRRELKESRIPTSRFGRMWNYGTLATGMGFGALNESLKRATGLSSDDSGTI